MFAISDTQAAIIATCEEVKDFLLTKNAAYGDSAITPLRIFSTADRVEQIKVRIDDKLSRLANWPGEADAPIEEDTVMDLIGYLILLRIATRREASA